MRLRYRYIFYFGDFLKDCTIRYATKLKHGILNFALFSGMIFVLPLEVRADEWVFSQSGLAGQYYGIMETKDRDNLKNLPNRAVFRADGRAEGAYLTSDCSRLGARADYTIVYRQHHKDYSEGDWRFYPYLLAEHRDYGRLTAGYSYNAAYLLYQGAGKISWVGIQDSNLTYFLSSANWKNRFKSVKFATQKSTHMLDDGRALKFSYFTPEIANTQFGFSYTPDNASRRGMVSRYARYQTTEDGYTAAMLNKWKLPAGTLYTSGAYGMFNRTDKEWAAGVRWVSGRFHISASYKKSYIDGKRNPISTQALSPYLPAFFDNYREGQAWDFGIGYDFGRFKTNLAYLHSEAENTRHRDDLIVQENRFTLNRYFDLFLVNGFLNSKGLNRNLTDNNKGYTIISGLAVKY